MSDLIKARKGIFIPDITVEMFRNASLEAVEELLVSGEMQDIILPSAQPEPSQVARDIATIIENEQDMRVLLSQPEIIRCKDCKYWEGEEREGFYYFEHCQRTGLDALCDDFCSRAERREECTP